MKNLKIQILVKNHQETIQKCLDSIPRNSEIIIVNTGSTDNTIKLCKGLKIIEKSGNRNDIRNSIDSNFYIEPWEYFIKYCPFEENSYVSILQNGILTKEIRFWTSGKFVNPIFEHLEITAGFSDTIIGSSFPNYDFVSLEQELREWMKEKPLDVKPYYYLSCILFAQRKYDEFLRISEYFMFNSRKRDISYVMNKYYYALVCFLNKNYKSAIQNLIQCLSIYPLMAEFWNLLGDIHYHGFKDFLKSKEFYENAIILGSRRKKNDLYPLEIRKYSEYPKKMIESCEKILKNI